MRPRPLIGAKTTSFPALPALLASPLHPAEETAGETRPGDELWVIVSLPDRGSAQVCVGRDADSLVFVSGTEK